MRHAQMAKSWRLCLPALISGEGQLADPPIPWREAAMAQKQSKRRSSAKSSKTATKYWSSDVTRRSDALDLESGVFTWDDPARIAGSLKRSAEQSDRRKSSPFRSAMSMLTFYINRAGKDLSEERRKVLEQAKDELRKAFGRAPH
jgi:hypothetical protein